MTVNSTLSTSCGYRDDETCLDNFLQQSEDDDSRALILDPKLGWEVYVYEFQSYLAKQPLH